MHAASHAAFVPNAETPPVPRTKVLDAPPRGMPDSAQADRIGPASSGPLPRLAAPPFAGGAAFHAPPETSGRVGGDLPNPMTSWVVVQHRAHQGRAARDQVRLAGFGSMWPRQWKVRRGADDVAEPMFNGYLFAAVEAGQVWGPIVRKCPAVLRVLTSSEGSALVVPPRVIERVLGLLGDDHDGIHDARPKVSPMGKLLAPGTPVRVLPGTLVGVDAELEAVTAKDAKARVQVLLKIMGAERLVTLPRDRVVEARPGASGSLHTP